MDFPNLNKEELMELKKVKHYSELKVTFMKQVEAMPDLVH